ncbi:glutathione S-transferase family protein [Pseudomonas sp. KNUC1026]|uniref:glutathione S-transferase family protein n=1 Tax=Pseudomonas sp. KNUC1026 TaxID=2893890 RepID=UPI001F18DBEF|nr:glutathione S-transferase N-terminal domain-containing protein [Pseudomonas sp. KNUC1026]UFH48125.1 glutathione S-transferase N-terminal domain-containing protein [Pseudomonas sp. KNUC1026]
MIDLYYRPTANGLKVGILVEELGIEHRLVPVNIREGAQQAEAFQRISANGRIPAIVDQARGLSLFESGAVLNYLGGALVPDVGTAEYWQVQQWLFWQVGHVTPYLSQLQVFRERAPEPIPFALEMLQREAERLYVVLEGALQAHEYAAGHHSVADIAIFPWIQPARQGIELARYPAVAAWRERIKARPAVQRAYARGREVAAQEKSLVLE